MKRYIQIVDGIMPFFAALFIRGIIYSIILTACTSLAGIPKLSSDAEYYVAVITMIVCGLVFYFWYQRITGESHSIPWPTSLTVRNGVLLILLGIACQFFVSGILSMIRPVFEKSFADYNNTLEGIFEGNFYLVLFYVIFLAPVTEELIFRGVMYKKLGNSLPFLGANLLQAVVFGIYHWNIVQGIYAFSIGLLLGWIHHKFKTLLAPILLHIIINASSFLMVLVPSGMAAYLISAVVGGIFVVFSLIMIRICIRKLI